MRSSRVRVVLDANVLVSGILFKDGSEAKILQLGEQGRISVFASLEILIEFVNVISRRKFQLTTQEVLAATEYLLSFVKIREPASTATIPIRDPEDVKFLECARDARAHFLVTGDKDLLTIREFANTQILSPSKFVSLTRHLSHG